MWNVKGRLLALPAYIRLVSKKLAVRRAYYKNCRQGWSIHVWNVEGRLLTLPANIRYGESNRQRWQTQ